MNELKIFDEREVFGKQFRIYGTPEEPLFLAQDVADWIDHTNSAVMIKSIDDDEKGLNNVYTLGGVQEMWFLTEDGLYEVLMQSRKPIAKQFKKKVKEILRDIRRHGAYLTDQKIEELLISPDTIINLATQIKEEREKKVRSGYIRRNRGCVSEGKRNTDAYHNPGRQYNARDREQHPIRACSSLLYPAERSHHGRERDGGCDEYQCRLTGVGTYG